MHHWYLMKINRNIFYSEQLVEQLVRYRVKYVIISPGSRSTPLVFAFLNNKKIKAVSVLDERSAGFFATGLARRTNSPVALVCTSGTAATEYYPAIVEAYQQRIPLVICTADRPPELRFSGANQTINQFNLYHNHIRFFAEFEFRAPSVENVLGVRETIEEGLRVCTSLDKGPIHFNIAFEKPFEPDMFTDESDIREYVKIKKKQAAKISTPLINIKSLSRKVDALWQKSKLPVIVLGAGQYAPSFLTKLNRFCEKYGITVFTDINSSARFGGNLKTGVALYQNYLSRVQENSNLKPDLVFIFGRYPISKALEDYLKALHIHKIIVNEHGDRHDPTDDGRTILSMEPIELFALLNKKQSANVAGKEYLEKLQFYENDFAIKMSRLIDSPKLTELSIIKSVLDKIPEGSNIFISNSLIVRDFDRIVPNTNKKLTIYQNRGASGIDGIISSALGMAFESKSKSYLVVGDLSFLYDLTALGIGTRLNIDLKIILINNNGGRIFDYLPSARFANVQSYFITPQNIDMKKACRAFGVPYFRAKSKMELEKNFSSFNDENGISVLECWVDNDVSREQRKKIAEV